MALVTTEKQPWERYFVYGDFVKVMDADETLDEAKITVTAVTIGTSPVDATGDVIDTPSIYKDDVLKRAYVRLMDGLDGSNYKFTIRIETSKANRWEVDGQLKVKEI